MKDEEMFFIIHPSSLILRLVTNQAYVVFRGYIAKS